MSMRNPIAKCGVLIDDEELTLRKWRAPVRYCPHGLCSTLKTDLLNDGARSSSKVWTNGISPASNWRAQKLIAFERDFDANPAVAALIVDLLE